MSGPDIEISGDWPATVRFVDAADLASDQDQVTWLTDGGKRVAAIVPVEAAELYEARFRGLPYPAAADSSLLEWCRRIVRENPPQDELAGQPCACQNLAGDCDGDHR